MQLTNVDAPQTAGALINPSPNHQPRKASTAPLVLFLLLMLASDFLIFPLIANSFRAPSGASIVAGYSLVLGQVYFVLTIGGLLSRVWIKGIAWATFYTAAAFGALSFGALNLGYTWWQFEVKDFLVVSWGLFCIPALIMLGTVPLHICRALWGWHLARPTDDAGVNSERRWQIEDLFLVTAAVASLLYICRLPTTAWEVNSAVAIPVLTTIGAALFGIGLVVVLPTIILAFRIERSLLRASFILLYHVCVPGIVLIAIAVVPALSQANLDSEVVIASLSVGLLSGIVNVIGCAALRKSGFELKRIARRQVTVSDGVSGKDTAIESSSFTSLRSALPPSSPSPFDEAAVEVQAPAANHSHRHWSIATLLLAILSSLLSLGISAWRTRIDEQNLALSKRLSSSGGSIAIVNRDVFSVTSGKEAGNETIKELAQHRKLTSLSLAHSQFTDEGITALRAFPELRWLDLSHTALTDEGLLQLRQLPINGLSVANTRVTAKGLRAFLLNTEIYELDASGLGLVDDDISMFQSIGKLRLRDNKLTDLGLASLKLYAPSGVISALDVSGNDIDGSGLVGMDVNHLVLERMPITDQSLVAIIGTSPTDKSFEFSETELTDASLLQLAKFTTIPCLKLGSGSITEAGLANSPPVNVQSLALTSSQFTGVCFKNWPAKLSVLDMSHSGVNDKTIRYVSNVTCHKLILAHTAITDEGLKSVAMSSAFEIDLTGTQITAAALGETRFQNVHTLRLGFHQFTPEEMQKLKARLPVTVELGREMHRGWWLKLSNP